MAADRNVTKDIVLKEWDCHAEKVRHATTVEQMAPSLGYFFMAVRPFIERETVTEQDCDDKMKKCPARAILTGDVETTKNALYRLAREHGAWLILVGYLLWQLAKANMKGS